MEYSTMALIGALVLTAIYSVKVYNKLISYKTQYENGYAQIDVQLKRRLDLIPNLVDVAKKYMEHEKEVLVRVTEARAGLMDASDRARLNPGSSGAMTALAVSEATMNEAMGGFNMKMEAYPDLKANTNMMQLSEELVSTENKISYARQGYNDLIQKFNEYRKSFPNIFIAGFTGFSEDASQLTFSESNEALNKPVDVKF